MTKHTIFPIFVKVLEVIDDWQWSRKIYHVKKWTLHIGTYFVAEHSKTPGLNKGDKFIIEERYYKGCER